MQVSDTEEPVPLLKDKKPRPPMSEKQKANFAKAREVRAQNIKAKKEEKILEAQRALLQKEGKLPTPQPQPQVKEEPEEDEQEEIVSKVSPSKAVKSKPQAQVAQKTSASALLKEEKKMPKQNIKQKARVVESSSEEDSEESSSEEEIIVVKRKKKAKPAKSSRIMIHEDSDPQEEEYEGIAPKKSASSFHDFFV